MRSKRLLVILPLLFLLTSLRAARASSLDFLSAPDIIRPGKYYDITVNAPQDGNAMLVLLSQDERFVSIVLSDYPLQEGPNLLTWDGMRHDDTILNPGDYILRLGMEDGVFTDWPFRIGNPYPIITQFNQSAQILAEATVSVSFSASEPGWLVVSLYSAADGVTYGLGEVEAYNGYNRYEWDGTLDGGRVPEGAYALLFTLHAPTGFESIPHTANIQVISPESGLTITDVPDDSTDAYDNPYDDLEPGDDGQESSMSRILEMLLGGTGGADTPDDVTDLLWDGVSWSDPNEEITDLLDDDWEDEPSPSPDSGIAFTDTVSESVDTIIIDATLDPDAAAASPSAVMYSSSPPYSSVWKGNYWSMTPGETDDAVIWDILMQPITVYDGGIRAGTKGHAYLMENPDGTGRRVAQLHTQSQGVNVIGETNEFGYVLVEAFSNYDRDFYPATDEEKAHAFDVKHGYVLASDLKTVNVMNDIAILVDKLTQRLYIFIRGERVTELLIATGKWVNSNDMLYETPPGEFITVEHAGGFASGNMYCDLAIRINGGVLIHEVPFKTNADGSRNYSSFEGWLGTKQSHGCIRVQRLKNNEGYNHGWLWNNLQRGKPYKVIIWDDVNRFDNPVTWYPNPQ